METVNLPSNPAKRYGEVDKTGDAPMPGALRVDAELTPRRRLPLWLRIVAGTIQLIVAAALLAIGYVLYTWIVDTAPKAQRKPPERVARLVEAVPVGLAKTGPVIEAWGTVAAAQTLVVRPEISGTIAWVDPEVTPGGRLRAGQLVARFDEDDLKLNLAQAETAIAQIDARIEIEKGQAAIGERELSRLSRNLTDEQKALVLRKPQMAQLQAERSAAIAQRDQAQNALDRAQVRTPFDALVLREQVAPGAMLAQGAEVATLVASDRFHIALAVPASALSWIKFDGSQVVRLTQPGIWPAGVERMGRIVRLNTALTETGRMAEVIVEVADPLAQETMNAGKPVLLIGAFLRGEILAQRIADAVQVDRAHVRDGNTVWVMNAEDKLEIRKIEILWRGADHVLVGEGLAPGERVVATALATAAPGMALRTRQPEGGS